MSPVCDKELQTMRETLAITAVGLISSVGRGVVDSCAAIRAGITRPQDIRHFGVLDEQTHDMVPLSGHPIAGLTDGFAPVARWLLMSRRALKDMLDSRTGLDRQPREYWSRCGVVFVLPVLDDARYFYAPKCRPDAISESFIDVLFDAEPLSIDLSHRALVHIGPAGLGAALERARNWLDAGEVDRVLIVATDSLLDAWSLAWLAGARRLKEPAGPAGLSPGEAATALLLERSRDRQGCLGRAACVVFEETDEPYLNSERRQGRALSAVIRRALVASQTKLSGDVYVNLNGETWRAAELGAALASLTAESTSEYRIVTPATSVGDVGAASGAMHIACAVRSFARGYAMTSHAWILSSSDYGEVSALCVEAT